MKLVWKCVLCVCLAVVVLAGAMAGSAAWRLTQLDAATAQRLAVAWGTELQAMGPDTGASARLAWRWDGDPGWRLWPRPQLRLRKVQALVGAADQPLLDIEQLALSLDWSLAWGAEPRLHDARASELRWRQVWPDAGLASEVHARQWRLGPADAQGARPLELDFDVVLRPAGPGTDGPPAAPWLQGKGRAQARWLPAPDAARWQDVQLRFAGQVAGQDVEDAQLDIAQWLHRPRAQLLEWRDLKLAARVGRKGSLGRLELQAPSLHAEAEQASGAPVTGQWVGERPWPLLWRLDSGAPRGRYGLLHWPQWRLSLAGAQGTRAAGQVQADLSWAGTAGGLRWDGLVGQFSVQPEGRAERQWSWRGQAQWNTRAAAWQIEGQALGGAPDAALWDGPFLSRGEWRRWPQPLLTGQLRLATLQLEPGKPGRWEHAMPWWWPDWRDWPAQVELQVGYLGALGMRLSNVQAQLTNDAAGLHLSEVSARLWEGALKASGHWQREGAAWRLDASLKDGDLAAVWGQGAATPVAAQDSAAAAQGRWSGQLSLGGQGLDSARWRGAFSADLGTGHWSGIDLRAALSAGTAPAHGEARTDWRRVQLDAQIDGDTTTLDTHLQGAGWRARGQGSLRWPQATLDLRWQALPPRRAHPATARLLGPWRSPELTRP